jgi:hypothetical protein
MRGSVVCFMAPATFLTSLGLIEAAITRTSAIVSAMAGAATSANSRTDGSPKDVNRIARMTLSPPDHPQAQQRGERIRCRQSATQT